MYIVLHSMLYIAAVPWLIRTVSAWMKAIYLLVQICSPINRLRKLQYFLFQLCRLFLKGRFFSDSHHSLI